MAERGRFELPVPVKVRPLSRRVRSTTLPPLRTAPIIPFEALHARFGAPEGTPQERGINGTPGAIETAELFGPRLYAEAWERSWDRAMKKVFSGEGVVESACPGSPCPNHATTDRRKADLRRPHKYDTSVDTRSIRAGKVFGPARGDRRASHFSRTPDRITPYRGIPFLSI
jgi:hypothetical protein